MAERVGLFAAGRPLIPRFARDRPQDCGRLPPSSREPQRGFCLGRLFSHATLCNRVAERVGFEPTCRNYPTIRFRVGAVVTASVPLLRPAGFCGAGILAET